MSTPAATPPRVVTTDDGTKLWVCRRVMNPDSDSKLHWRCGQGNDFSSTHCVRCGQVRPFTPPRCPSCGWLLEPRPYAEVYNNPLGLWEMVCPNPNRPGQPFRPCALPVGSVGGFRVVSPREAVYR
jgi:hypothetical protein